MSIAAKIVAEKIVVRMYRNLLGDCFLIRITDADGTHRHVLIDCGLLQGLKNAKDRMIAVAEDIVATCEGVIDLLVITHEHWDHISGFAQAKDILLNPDRITYRNLWMAWTEDPENKDAIGLRTAFEQRKSAVARFALALGASATRRTSATLVDGLDGFIGPFDDADGALGIAPSGRLTGRRILEELKQQARNVRYLKPGMVLDTPTEPDGGAALPAAVLGPPVAESRLFKDMPSRGDDKETYLDEQFLAYSLLAVDETQDGLAQIDFTSPFPQRYWDGLQVDLGDGDTARRNDPRWDDPTDPPRKWFYNHYFATSDDEQRDQSFRRIDGEWLHTASSLALKLDSDTNNTSLVLAFRLPDDNFMLFAADAQVGNWLSWHDQPYEFGSGPITAEAILNRTRLYKVGHHGSHNATLRGKGVMMMTRHDLVAMVSTVEDEAREQGKSPPGWLMPNPDVKAALLERCGGRLIRGDRRWDGDADAAAFGLQPDFALALDEASPLYVDYTIYDATAATAGGGAAARKKPVRKRKAA